MKQNRKRYYRDITEWTIIFLLRFIFQDLILISGLLIFFSEKFSFYFVYFFFGIVFWGHNTIQSLHNQSRSTVCIAGNKTDLFLVRVGLQQAYALSLVMFKIFMKAQPGAVIFFPLLQEMILSCKLLLRRNSSMCWSSQAHFEVTGKRVSIDKSEDVVLDQRKEVKFLDY